MPPTYNHRSYVGPEHNYYVFGPQVFINLLRFAGVQPDNKLLDVGCGSLRVGRLLIPYLNEGCYYGIEPAEEHLMAGFDEELSPAAIKKAPSFHVATDFTTPEDWPARFDIVCAIQVFIHCGPEQLEDFLTKMRARTDVIWITLKIDEEGHTKPWDPGFQRYLAAHYQDTTYSMPGLRKILNKTKWKIAWRSEAVDTCVQFILHHK